MTKSQLNQIRFAKQRIFSLEQKILHYKEMAQKTTSVIDAQKVQSPFSNAIEENVCNFVDLAKLAQQEMDDYLKLCKEAEDAISGLNDARQKSIMELRYVCSKNWEEIADQLDLDVSWVHRIHGKALKNILEYSDNPQLKTTTNLDTM